MTKSPRLLVRFIVLLVLGSTLLGLYSARGDLTPHITRMLADEGKWFAEQTPPVPLMPQLFDLGIVDANQDGLLDIYTSNHNYRQALWIADGHGSYRDSLSEWGLDQNKAFPGWEQSMQPPPIDKQGLYIYWVGDTIHIRTHQTTQPVRLRMHIFSTVEIKRNDGFQVEQLSSKALNKVVTETSLVQCFCGLSAILPVFRKITEGFSNNLLELNKFLNNVCIIRVNRLRNVFSPRPSVPSGHQRGK